MHDQQNTDILVNDYLTLVSGHIQSYILYNVVLRYNVYVGYIIIIESDKKKT